MVPVIAIGFDNLCKVIDTHNQQAIEHTKKLTDLKLCLKALTVAHSISNFTCPLSASVKQTQIIHWLLKVVQYLHLLIPSVTSLVMMLEEEMASPSAQVGIPVLHKHKYGVSYNI